MLSVMALAAAALSLTPAAASAAQGFNQGYAPVSSVYTLSDPGYFDLGGAGGMFPGLYEPYSTANNPELWRTYWLEGADARDTYNENQRYYERLRDVQRGQAQADNFNDYYNR